VNVARHLLWLALLFPAVGWAQATADSDPQLQELTQALLDTANELRRTYPHLQRELRGGAAGIHAQLRQLQEKGTLPTPAKFREDMRRWKAQIRETILNADDPEQEQLIDRFLAARVDQIEAETARWERLAQAEGRAFDAQQARAWVVQRWTCLARTVLLGGSQRAALEQRKVRDVSAAALETAAGKAVQVTSQQLFPPRPPWSEPSYAFEPEQVSPLLWRAALVALRSEGAEDSSTESKWLSMNREAIAAEVARWLAEAQEQQRAVTEDAVRASVLTRYRAQARLLELAATAAARDTLQRRYPNLSSDELTAAYNQAALALSETTLPAAPPWESPAYEVDEERALRKLRERAAQLLRPARRPQLSPAEAKLQEASRLIERGEKKARAYMRGLASGESGPALLEEACTALRRGVDRMSAALEQPECRGPDGLTKPELEDYEAQLSTATLLLADLEKQRR
jgi:hypothetical protein